MDHSSLGSGETVSEARSPGQSEEHWWRSYLLQENILSVTQNINRPDALASPKMKPNRVMDVVQEMPATTASGTDETGLGSADPIIAVRKLGIYECYEKAPYRSIRHGSYFQVYEECLEKYRNKPLVFVEIGVLDGGSLFMWREYLGPRARVIGIDLNPATKLYEKDGFEIYIGNQADPHFWDEFFSQVGDVDVVLDDGGHGNDEQIVTAHKCIPHIKDGGVLIVEDTHTSYMAVFGNPSKYSFIKWAKLLIDNINSRLPGISASTLPHNRIVYSASFYESIVCFNIDRRKCFQNFATVNSGTTLNHEDCGRRGAAIETVGKVSARLSRRFHFLKRLTILKMFRSVLFRLLSCCNKQDRELRRYFY